MNKRRKRKSQFLIERKISIESKVNRERKSVQFKEKRKEKKKNLSIVLKFVKLNFVWWKKESETMEHQTQQDMASGSPAEIKNDPG